jgi:hypothetical protein
MLTLLLKLSYLSILYCRHITSSSEILMVDSVMVYHDYHDIIARLRVM